MDTRGKLFLNREFSDCWNNHRNGKIKYYNQVPFIFSPKRHPLVLTVHMNMNYHKNVIYQAIKEAIEKKVAFIRFITDDPIKINNFSNETRYTYIIRLNKSLDKIFNSFNDSTKRRIKIAKSNKIECKIVDDLSEFDKWWYGNYLRWIKKNKFIKENYDFMKLAVKHNSFSKLFLAYHKNEIAAGLFILLSPDKKAYIWLSSNNKKYIKMCPDHFLQWKAIEWLKKNGCEYCDLGGISHSKIFKEGFSCELSTWHLYDLEFSPILKRIIFIGDKYKKIITKKY